MLLFVDGSRIMSKILADIGEVPLGGSGGSSGYENSPAHQGAEGAPGRLDSYQPALEPNFITRFFASLVPNPFSWFVSCNREPPAKQDHAEQDQAKQDQDTLTKKSTKDIAGAVIQAPQLHFQPSRPSEEDLKELEKYLAEASKPLADDPKILAMVFGNPAYELNRLKDFADWLNGKADTKFDKANADNKAMRELQKTLKVTIEGQTDTSGPAEENLKASQRSADFVRRILIGLGVDPKRLEAIGYGETRPVVPEIGSDKEIFLAKTMNRRVTFRISTPTAATEPK